MKKIVRLGLILSVFIVASSCWSTKKIEDSSRDGSSFEKAIIVKSIDQEYQYVKKACTDCQLLGQSLKSHKKKYYDVLKLKKPNGEVVSYYFDISKFYGKSSLFRKRF